MADPATQFSPATLQYNTYTPVKGGDLGGSHLFGGAGELWAKVGQTALDAAGQLNQTAQMMQQSPLNPAVKEKMNYAVDQYKLAQEHDNWVRAHKNAGQMIVTTGPEGASTVAGAGTDIDPMVRLALRSSKPATPPPPTTTTEEPKPTVTTQPTTVPETGEEGYSASYGASAAQRAQPQSEPTKPSQPSEPSDALVAPGSASTDNDFLLRQMIQNRGSAAAPEGTPASMTFRNPATGNIEPRSLFAPRTSAPAPPAPGAPPAQPPVQSQTPAAASQADQAAMQQWQQQNAHPVMTSQEALGWMKNQTTLAQDATYLPMGGPGGAPAFAFHMKGGGMNLVPVSQMIQKGAGPLVAAQSTSQVISATDRAQQPPGAMPSGTGMGAPQGQPAMGPQAPPQIAQGPPAAPTGPMPSGTGMGAPQGLARPIAPPAPGAYNATAYQMPQGPTITQTGNVNPALMAGGTDEQVLAAARAAAQPGPQITDPSDFNANIHPYSKADLSKMPKDPDLGSYGGFQWRQDKTNATVYAVQKSPEPFHELRWNAGRDQWDNYWVENGQLMKQVQDARANTPLMKMVSDTQIENMSEEDLKDTLDQAVRLAKTGGDASDMNSLHIRGTINQSQSLARTIAMLEAAKKEGISPRLFSGGAQESSEQAAKRGETLPAEGEEYPLPVPQDPHNPSNWGAVPGILWDLGWAGSHGARANLTRGQISPLADQMKSELKYFGEQMQQTPGINVTTEPKAQQPQVRLSGGYQGFGGSADVKLPTDESTLKNIQRISQGNNIDDMIAGAKELKKKVDNDIVDSTDRATRMSYRTPPQFKKAAQAIKDGKNIEDNENQFVDRNGNPQMPDHFKNPPGRASKIPIGTGIEPNTQVQDELKRFYGDRPIPTMQFDTIDEATKFAKGAKPGTLYDVKDEQGKIHHMRVD